MQDTISIKDLSFRFKDYVLKNVNLTIKKGDFVNLFGPNGGGKTTLLKLILGLLTPEKGSIKIFGLSPKKASKLIGYIPQNPQIKPDFPITCLELVLLGCVKKSKFFGNYPHDIIKRAKDLLTKVNLTNYINSPIRELSGGQLQRALIAKALILDPEILILDEPTSNIDIPSQQEIFELILKYRNKKTILMVTHNLDIIINQVKDVILVDKTVTKIPPKEICEHFALGLYHNPLLKGPKDD